MEREEANREARLRAIDGFIEANKDALPKAAASSARSRIQGIIADLATHGEVQESSRRTAAGITARLNAARRALLSDQMLPVSRIAAAELPQQPEFAGLKMPASNLSHARLVAAGESMADLGAPHSDVFVQGGLSPDFGVKLRQAAASLKSAVDARSAAKQTRAGAGGALKAKLAVATKQVRVLDALVRVDANGDAGLLAKWDVARHVAKSPIARFTGSVTAAPAAVVPVLPAAAPVVPPVPVIPVVPVVPATHGTPTA
ncbi:MAG TPA: hypothetical protein VH277_09965 [Gemmatimonadaceae bacterium]|jgi:hypothetical protein|nr:hypothetical protein [Gemmatimonadaceae bacterium]